MKLKWKRLGSDLVADDGRGGRWELAKTWDGSWWLDHTPYNPNYDTTGSFYRLREAKEAAQLSNDKDRSEQS